MQISRHSANCRLSSTGAGSRFALYAGIDLVAVPLLEALVEGDGDVAGRLALEQFAEEAREAEHRVDRIAVAVGHLDGDRVVRTEDEDAGVDEVEHGPGRE